MARFAPVILALLTACGGGGRGSDEPDAGDGGHDADVGPDARVPRPAFTLEDLGLDALPPCDEDDDCTDGLRCEPRYGRCVDCIFDVECGVGAFCRDRRCISSEPCTSNADCADDVADRTACDPLNGKCVECLEDAMCGTGEVCDARRCVAGTRCRNSLDCSSGDVCDRARDLCVACGVDADCGEEEVCFDHACRTACEGDRACAAGGGLCAPTLGFCVECVEDEDCPGDYHCDDGTCRVDVCQQGQSSCSMGSVSTCSTDGRNFVHEGCQSQNATCAQTSGGASCMPWQCTPGATFCDAITGERVVCASNGLSEVSREACATGTACDSGVCQPIVCTPSTSFCDGQTVRLCNPLGTSSSLGWTCSASRVCTGAPNAQCVPRVCTPGALACVGGYAGTCDGSALALEPGAVDCADDDQACLNGACVPRICTPGATFCSGTQIWRCAESGLSSSLSTDCAWNANNCVTENGTATCVAQTCTPNAPVCDGARVATCNANGTAFGPPYTECTGSNDACGDGQCRPAVCTPNAYFCEDDRLMRCNAGGTAATTQQVCSANNHCNAAMQACRPDVCTASQMGCDGNGTAMCNLDGSGFVGTRTECGPSTTCSAGTCMPHVCPPNAFRCGTTGSSTTPLYRCAANGLSEPVFDSCTNNSETCSAANGACSPIVCTAGAVRCAGASIEACAPDRLSWLTTTSCADSQQLCLGGACVAQQIETTTTTNGNFAAMDALRGHYVEVTQERLLVRFEASLRIANGQSRTLTWIVYESMTRNGPYAPIAQVTTTANGNGAFQWYGSDPLNATLRAGRFYAIAVHAQGTVEYGFRNNVSTVNLSFGSLWSGVYENTSTPPATLVGETRNTYYGQRFTTAAAPP